MSVATKPAHGVSAAELMDQLNTETAKLNAWIRTQANSPAQRPWFADTGGATGTGNLAKGRVAANQMKMQAHRWRWREINPYLQQDRRDRAQRGSQAAGDHRPPGHPADQSGIGRTAADHQHDPLRDRDLQSRRHRARACAQPEREPHDPVGQGRLHECRRRALRMPPRRHRVHAERHLARPRQ